MENKETKIEQLLRNHKLPGAPADLKDKIFNPNKTISFKPLITTAAAVIIIAAVTAIICQTPPNTTAPQTDEPTLAQLEYAMNRAAQAAKLLAIAQIFEKQPGGENHAKELYSEVAQCYPDLEIAKQAKSKLKTY